MGLGLRCLCVLFLCNVVSDFSLCCVCITSFCLMFLLDWHESRKSFEYDAVVQAE